MSKKKTTPTIRERADEVVDNAREQAIEAYDQARKSARKARKDASEQIENAPLIALGGGLALGALIAALLPTSKKEKELLGPTTRRIKDAASDAANAAREAGTARLGELGLTKDKGSETFRQVIDGALDALKTSAQAASKSVKGE